MKPLSVPIVRLRRARPSDGTALDRLRKTARMFNSLPNPATAGAAGLDLYWDEPEGGFIEPGERRKVRTGISIAVPEGYEAQVRARSGLAAEHGITLANGIGTIDSDYRGEIVVILINLGTERVEFKVGYRIAQLVFAPVAHVAWQEVDALPDSARGAKGFGSTGK